MLKTCIYCGVDCDEYEPEHGADCPFTTDLWPVTPDDLGMRAPDDSYAHGMRCHDCRTLFEVGDIYTLRPHADDSDFNDVVCVGCRVLVPEAVDV